jgi:hypothetical protein
VSLRTPESIRQLLEAIFEADFEASAYGYRPKRGAEDAVKEVHRLLCQGYTEVVDADLSKYFDTNPHHELMQKIEQRVVDRQMLKFIKGWLKVPVEGRDEPGESTHDRRQEEQDGDAARRSHQSFAGQHLHASILGAMESAKKARAISGASRQLRR